MGEKGWNIAPAEGSRIERIDEDVDSGGFILGFDVGKPSEQIEKKVTRLGRKLG